MLTKYLTRDATKLSMGRIDKVEYKIGHWILM
jgi:hypothetical protein